MIGEIAIMVGFVLVGMLLLAMAYRVGKAEAWEGFAEDARRIALETLAEFIGEVIEVRPGLRVRIERVDEEATDDV